MIEVKNLVKRYGATEAVRGISFTVGDGLICGFLGPNGAGKSTTMNIITGCLAATEGEVCVNGYDIYEEPIMAKSNIGYLPEQPPLYMDMTAREYLEFVGRAKGLNGEKLYGAVDRALEKTGLEEYADRLIKNLSKGYKQRVGIAQAIIGDPAIVILDEPTVGLDPRQVIEIRELIRELGKERTVILSSHILTEISAVCDYVIIIADGRIVASDTLENLVQLYEGKNYVDIIARGDEAKLRRAAESLPAVLGIETEQAELGRVHMRIAVDKNNDIREELFFRFADMKAPIIAMEYEEITLEKVFLELTEGSRAQPEPEADELDGADSAPASSDGTEDTSDDNGKTKREQGSDDYKPLFGGN